MKQKKYCSSCRYHSVGGVKDGKHDNWCCKVGHPASKAIGHCKNKNLREPNSPQRPIHRYRRRQP